MVRDGGWEWTAPEQGPGGNCQGHEELAKVEMPPSTRASNPTVPFQGPNCIKKRLFTYFTY